MSATIASTTTTMAMTSSSRTSMSTISTHLLVDLAWDELDLTLDGDVGAGLPRHLLALLDWLLDGLLLGNTGAFLLGVLTALSAGNLYSLLAALLLRLRLTGLDRDLATALLRLLTTFWGSVAPSIGGLGWLTLSHVLRGAFVLIGGGADLEVRK